MTRLHKLSILGLALLLVPACTTSDPMTATSTETSGDGDGDGDSGDGDGDAGDGDGDAGDGDGDAGDGDGDAGDGDGDGDAGDGDGDAGDGDGDGDTGDGDGDTGDGDGDPGIPEMIEPGSITATASGEAYLQAFNTLGMDVNAVVDGTGLDNIGFDGLHATIFNNGTFWHGNDIETDAVIDIDLGAVYDITEIYFWNYNSHNGFFERGLASFDVSASIDGENYVMIFDDFAVEPADMGDTHPAKMYPFAVDEVRYLQLSNFQTIMDNDGNGGFAEIMFNAIPQP